MRDVARSLIAERNGIALQRSKIGKGIGRKVTAATWMWAIRVDVRADGYGAEH